ncbi:hypothetical protein RhiirA4_497810 [Rhizophagus irregularis]|uniref:Protein kinase domain-containing protein n=1 Tax=Rhizophagus irregularis TaxID=588596 RepID=A0A2I1FUC8_9GLOM|nr:hypothetical protein RhiirA4_497810 [Rhizophagus irregularis]
MDYNPESSFRSLSPSGSQDESQSYGNCSECKQRRTAVAWCKNCDIAILKENFCSWTSGNSIIDKFIRDTQLSANENMDHLEWIEFDQFDLVENINKRGAFSSIYSAVWMEGPRCNLNEEAEVWNRNGPIKVILKRLDDSQSMSLEFINQLYKYHKCLQNGALADCFGITKDLTSCYMFVIKYYKNGNLYSYLDETIGILCWRDIVDMLWSISEGLHVIHEHNLVHGHLHGGNRPTASQLCEYLGNWTAICDDTDPSDLSNQFDLAEEIKFADLDKLKFNIAPCHENAIYFSRPLDSTINSESSTQFFSGKM